MWFSWILVVEQVVGLTWGMPPDLQAKVGKTGVFVDQQISLQRGEHNATGRTLLGCTGLHDREVPILLWVWGTSSYL